MTRGIYAAIVDEDGSALINKAVTPLIISQAQQNRPLTDAFSTANDIASNLVLDQDYRINRRYWEIVLLPAGEKKIAYLTDSLDGLWKSASRGVLAFTAVWKMKFCNVRC